MLQPMRIIDFNETSFCVRQKNIKLQYLYSFADGWMTIPMGITNCPPGLEYLTLIDQLLVKQKIRLLEVFTGFEQNNKFEVKNALGQNVRNCRHFSHSMFIFIHILSKLDLLGH